MDKLNLEKDDRKFFVNLNVNNRNFLADLSKFHMTILIATTSLILSGYGIFVSLTSIVWTELFSLYELFLIYFDVLLFLLLILVPFWYSNIRSSKKDIKSAMNLNEQYQKHLRELNINSGDRYI